MLIPFGLSAKWKWKQLCIGGKGGCGCADLNDTHCTVINSVSTLFTIACSNIDGGGGGGWGRAALWEIIGKLITPREGEVSPLILQLVVATGIKNE